jgi:hypothetical protein
MVAIEGLEEQHFIAWVEEGHRSGMKSARRSGRDKDFVVGIVIK